MKIFQNSEFKSFPWLRYLDKIFGVWTQGSQKLKELFNCINSLYSTIKLPMDCSKTEINFLGITVTKVSKTLETDLYCKPTDMYQYLHNQSCHVMCKNDLLHTDRL